LSEKHSHISDNGNLKTCTRLVTRKKFLGLVEFPRDDIETLRITNKINGFATVADDDKKLLKIAKTAILEL